MRRIIIAVLLLLLSSVQTQASAIEKGTSAAGSELVVPINVKWSTSLSTGCSGALLTPYVVVTAGHCLLDEAGLISTVAYVGPPGSDKLQTRDWLKAYKVYLPSDYTGDKTAGIIGASDLGFILLSSPLKLNTKISLAPETLISSLKSSGAKVRVYGYGDTSDSGAPAATPSYFDGNLDSFQMTDPNRGSLNSVEANVCKGDSGGPVFYITPTKITLIGAVTNTNLSVNCSAKIQTGKYYTGFTYINRYANLVAEVMADAATMISEQKQSDIDDLKTSLDELNSQYEEMAQKIGEYDDEVSLLKLEVAKYKSAGVKMITCTKGVVEKYVVAANPKCPSGYRLKK